MPNRRQAVRRSHFGWSLHQVNYLIRGTATVQQPPCSSAEWVSLTLRQACSRENPGSAMCVQNLDDSRGLAIRITYHISLRPSSLWEPRHPLLKVVSFISVLVPGGSPTSALSEIGKRCSGPAAGLNSVSSVASGWV